MNMGTVQTLRATRTTDNGMYFTDGEAEVLLPRSEVLSEWHPGVEVALFLYRDSEDRPTATRTKPVAQVDEAAMMTVVDAGPLGAFVSWGLRKDLLVPHSEQAMPLAVGQSALVLVQLDPATDRLFGTTKISGRLNRNLSGFEPGQAVDCLVWRLHDQGWTVLVNHRWQGLVYRNESPRPLKPGEALTGWVSGLRDDGKLDVRLRPQGFQAANPDAEGRILEALAKAGGRLRLTDRSSPEEIQALLGLSKKAFKVACGTLYKRGEIDLEPSAISRKEAES